MYCKSCGTKLKKDAKYCHICGEVISSDEEEKVENKSSSSEGKGFAIASVVLGGCSLIFGYAFIFLPIIGLILGLCNKEKNPLRTIGIVLNSVGIGLIIIVWSFIIYAFSVFSNYAFENFDGFKNFIREVINDDDRYERREYYDYIEETPI